MTLVQVFSSLFQFYEDLTSCGNFCRSLLVHPNIMFQRDLATATLFTNILQMTTNTTILNMKWSRCNLEYKS